MSDIIIDKEQLGELTKYTCKLTGSYIIFMQLHEYILLDESYLNWENPKTVLYLLNYGFNDIIKTYGNKYKSFRYYVCNTDTSIIDMNKWDLLEMDEEKTLLECELTKALDNILECFMG